MNNGLRHAITFGLGATATLTAVYCQSVVAFLNANQGVLTTVGTLALATAAVVGLFIKKR